MAGTAHTASILAAMDVQPSGAAPPHDYALSSALRAPKGRITFERLVRSVTRFNRDAVLEIGARLCWYVYRHPELMTGANPHYEQHYLAHAYADGVMALACMYGRPRGRAHPTEVDFRLLCWELHVCEDYAAAKTGCGQEEIAKSAPKYQGLLDSADSGSRLLQQLPPHATAYAHVVASVGRMASHQWHSFTRVAEDRVRGCLVFEHMIERCSEPEKLRSAEKAYFRTTYDRFLWCCMALVAFANRDPKGQPCPGFVRFALDEMPTAPDDFPITFDDIAVVAQVLAKDFDAFRALGGELERRPAWQRSHSPEVRALSKYPLIRGPAANGNMQVLLPSPFKVLAAASDRLLFDFVDFLEDNSLVSDAYGLRGRAFELHLRKHAEAVDNLVDVDTLEALSGRRPDFVWLGTEFGVVVEVKFGLSPNHERYHLSPPALLEAWKRAAGAVEQADEFIENHRDDIPCDRLPARWVTIVVTYEDLAREATWFDVAAKRWGLLNGTAFEAMHIENATSFERFTLHSTADDYARAVIKRWSEIDPNSLSQPVLQPPSGPPHPMYVEAWKRLLPETACPWAERSE